MRYFALASLCLLITISASSQGLADVGVKSIDAPKPSACGSQDVIVTVENYGATSVSNFTVQWEIDGISQIPYSATTTIPSGGTAQVTIGNYNFANPGTALIEASTLNPNSLPDLTPWNDTAWYTTSVRLSGTYTVGTGASDFATFTDACNALKTYGICGPVVMDVQPNAGAYNDRILLTAITGSSATNTITWKGNGEVLSHTGAYSTRATVDLNGTDYVIFDNLGIEAAGTTYGWGIWIHNNANNNIVRNCSIEIKSTSSSSSNSAGVMFSSSSTSAFGYSSNGNLNRFVNNTINGGYYGFRLNGTSSGLGCLDNVIQGNHITDFYAYGVYVYNNTGTQVIENDIERPTRTSMTTYYGVYISGSGSDSKKINVSKNRFHNTNGAGTTHSAIGVYITNQDVSAANANLVINNLFYDFNGTGGTIYGIYNSSSNGFKVYHNTIDFAHTQVTSSGSAYGMFYSSSMSGLDIRNNIVSITRGGSSTKYCMYFSSYPSKTLDYNLYYMNPAAGTGYVGRWGGNRTTLAQWQSAGSHDNNSSFGDPIYLNKGSQDYHALSSLADATGTGVGVGDDIDGVGRSSTTPDLGAYELPPVPEDAGIVSIDNPAAPFCAGTHTVKVTMHNYGTQPLTSATITLDFNGTVTNTSWTGNLASGSSTQVTLSSYAMNSTLTYAVSAWTSNPNGKTDPHAFNDTASVSLKSSLSGTYTVGLGGDFTTFADACAALNSYGVCGPVVMDVINSAAAYNEQIRLNDIQGTSTTNTVTWKGNGNTVSFSGAYGNAFTVELNGADHIIFDSLHIVAAGSTYGWGYWFHNNADSNIVRNSTIRILSTSTSSSTNMGVVFSGCNTSGTCSGANGNGNLFENDSIFGGYYGMTIIGNSNGTDCYANKVRNCVLQDFRAYGIYMSNNEATEITGNDISRPTRTSITTFYGIMLSGSGSDSKKVRIEKNRIHNTNGGSTTGYSAYGIYISSQDVSKANANLIANNAIYDFNASGGNNYGIFNSSSNGVNIWYNTIDLSHQSATSGTTYGIYFSSYITTNDVKNNVFRILRSGSSTKYGFYFSSSSPITCDYNAFHIQPTAGTGNIGHRGSTYASLQAWQTATGYDANSNEGDPQFANPAIGDFRTYGASTSGMATPLSVLDDINSVTRSTNQPDIGAFEVPPLPDDIGITSIDQPTLPICPGTYGVAVTMTNLGNNTVTSAQIDLDINGSTTTVNWSGTLAVGADTTMIITSYAFIAGVNYTVMAWTSKPNGNNDSQPKNDTTAYSNVRTGMVGTFTINGNGGANYTSYTDAIQDLVDLGLCGPVVFNTTSSGYVYSENIRLPLIQGASATNTITFNGGGEALLPSTSFSNRAAIRFDGAQWITLNEIDVDLSGTSYGWGVQFMGNATDNQVNKCDFQLRTQNSNFAAFVMSSSSTSVTGAGANGSRNLIQNNTVYGGYYGIVARGNSGGAGLQDNVFRKNVFRDVYVFQIYLYDNDGTIIDGNDFSRATLSSSTTFYGAYITGSGTDCKNLQIKNNRWHHTGVGNYTFYGIYLSNQDAASGKDNYFINNAIYEINSTSGNTYGVVTSSSDRSHFWHNTVDLANQSASSGTTVGYYNTSSRYSSFRNNIATISRGGSGSKYCLYVSGSQTGSTYDYNNYVMASTSGTNNVAYYNGNQQTLALLQTNSNQEANSLDLDPFYINVTSGDLTPTNASLDDMGTPMGVNADIRNQSRSNTTPDIGAFEFIVGPDDAGVVSIIQPNGIVCPGLTDIVVEVRNFGNNQLDSAEVHWEVNGVPQTTFHWKGSLAPTATTLVNLGTYTFVPGTTYDLIFWTSNPNGNNDLNPANDTSAIYNLQMGLTGTYTINGAGVGDYPSYGAAIQDLKSFGLCGPVVFNVISTGYTYNERLVLDEIVGASGTNTITFNGNGQTLTYNTNSGARSVVEMNGGDHFIFDNINVDLASRTYGWGFRFFNGADSNVIRNCTVLTNLSQTSSSTTIPIAFSSSTSFATGSGNNGNYNIIENNILSGGYYCVTLVGNSNGTDCNQNKIRNNTIQDFRAIGIYAYNVDGTIISGNDIARPTRTSITTFYGIYLSGSGTDSKRNLIEKNRIHNTNGASSSSTIYCIRLDYQTVPTGFENRIINNAIYNVNNSTGSVYGLYLYQSHGLIIQHNTLDFSHTSTSSSTHYAVRVDRTRNVTFENNILTIRRNNTSTKYGIYAGSSSTVPQQSKFDYNSYYIVTPAGGDYVAYWGSSYTTLASYQTGSGQEANSLWLDPQYVNVPGGDLTPGNVALSSYAHNVGVNDDIVGIYRSARPEPGAFEIAFDDDLGITAVLTPTSGCDLSGTSMLTVEVTNFGNNDQDSFDVGYRLTGATIGAATQSHYPKVVPSFDTSHFTFSIPINFSTYGAYNFTIWTALTGDEDLSNDTLRITIYNNSAVVADAGVDKNICNGAVAWLGGAPTGSGGTGPGTYTYSWSPGFTLNNDKSSNPYSGTSVPETYVVVVTDTFGCTDADTVKVGIITANIPTADAGPDTSKCRSGSVVIGGNPTGSGANNPFSYAWVPNHEVNNPALANPGSIATESMIQYVIVTDNNGCTDADSMYMDVVRGPLPIATTTQTEACFGETFKVFADPGVLSREHAVLITEAGVNSTNTLEIQNMSSWEINVDGWKVAISNNWYNINTVHPKVQTLSGTMKPGQIMQWTESSGSPNYWGGSINWHNSRNGWIVILDEQGDIVDFVAWGWNNGDINGMNATVEGYTVQPKNHWNGVGIYSQGLPWGQVLNRKGSSDGDDNKDWNMRPATTGSPNPGLVLPFAYPAPPYSLVWPTNGAITDTNYLTPLASQYHVVEVTDGTGCTGKDSFYVEVFYLVSNAGVDKVSCDVQPVTLGANPAAYAGSGRYSYSWSPTNDLSASDIPNPIANPSSTQHYTLTVYDSASDCYHNDEVLVTVTTSLPVANAGTGGDVCIGQGMIIGGNPTATGSYPPFTYSWAPANRVDDPTKDHPLALPIVPTMYTLTATDNYGCSGIDTVFLTVKPQPLVNAGVDTIICKADTVQLGGNPTASGTPSPYNYQWGPFQTISNIGIANPNVWPSSSTDYHVSVTDSNGCLNTDTVRVIVSPDPVVNAGADREICLLDSTVLGGSPTATGGAGGLLYDWQPALGLSSTSAANPKASPAVTTSYTLTVYDVLGCTGAGTDTVTVVVNPLPVADAGADRSICLNDTTILGGSPVATGGTGNYSFDWIPALGLVDPNVGKAVALPTDTTTYALQVTDAKGCRSTDQLEVIVNPLPQVDAGDTLWLCTNVAGTLGGSPTAQDGVGPYMFSWSPIVGIIDPSIANPTVLLTADRQYHVLVTDMNGCMGSDSIEARISDIEVEAGMATILCAGTNLPLGGTPTAKGGVGPYSFSWTPAVGLSSATISNPTTNITSDTTYRVEVSDARGCMGEDTIAIEVTGSPTADAGANATLCIGDTVQIGGSPSAIGGVGPYTYQWFPAGGLTSSIVENPHCLATVTTTYTLIVTDAKGCTAQDMITIDIKDDLRVDAGFFKQACQNVQVTLGGSPAAWNSTGPYTYDWQPVNGLSASNVANPVATPLTSTTYTLRVTDGFGCEKTDFVQLIVDPLPLADAGADKAVCGGDPAQIGGPVPASFGTPPYTYQWLPLSGLTSPNFGNTDAKPSINTVYTLHITDSRGCQHSDDVSVLLAPSPIADAGPDLKTCEGVQVVIGGAFPATGGTQPYTYDWSPAPSLNSNIIGKPAATPASTTTYVLKVTDKAGCTSTDQMVLTIDPTPGVDAGKDTILCGSQPAMLGGSPTAFGGTGSYTYLWVPAKNLSNPGAANPSVTSTPGPATVYTVFATDANGCQASDTVSVGYHAMPVAGFLPVVQGMGVQITDQSSFATTWSYDFGDGHVDTTQNPYHIYLQPGNYQICQTVTNLQQCKETICKPVEILLSSIEDVVSEDFNLFPNPTDGIIYLQTLRPAEIGEYALLVRNALGQVILEETVKPGTLNDIRIINLSSFAAGTYLISVQTEKGRQDFKVNRIR